MCVAHRAYATWSQVQRRLPRARRRHSEVRLAAASAAAAVVFPPLPPLLQAATQSAILESVAEQAQHQQNANAKLFEDKRMLEQQFADAKRQFVESQQAAITNAAAADQSQSAVRNLRQALEQAQTMRGEVNAATQAHMNQLHAMF